MLTLIGDGIENPANAAALADAAGLFGGRCLLRDGGTLGDAGPSEVEVTWLSAGELKGRYSPLVALETVPNAASVYGFRLPKSPAGRSAALVVGNERRGIRRDLLTAADRAVRIPLFSPALDSLNVAAAAAVGLYYLTRGGGGTLQVRPEPRRRRPELALLGPQDHVELGSALRSAAAFGWERVFVEDSARVWFGGERAVVAEGRAAARRHRNALHVIPLLPAQRYPFDEVCVVRTLRRGGPAETGTPLTRAALARGPRQLLAIPDESRPGAGGADWHRFAPVVRFVDLDLPPGGRLDGCYRFRLVATIALAEAARQVGRRAGAVSGRARRWEPEYGSVVRLLPAAGGEVVTAGELEQY